MHIDARQSLALLSRLRLRLRRFCCGRPMDEF
jgi:hypothetical protein